MKIRKQVVRTTWEVIELTQTQELYLRAQVAQGKMRKPIIVDDSTLLTETHKKWIDCITLPKLRK